MIDEIDRTDAWAPRDANCNDGMKRCTFTVTREEGMPSVIDVPLQIATKSYLSVGDQGLDGVFKPVTFSFSGAMSLVAIGSAMLSYIAF